MELKNTRKILSIILTVIIAVSSVCYSASMVLSNTFGSQKFISGHLITSELVSESEKQLDMKFEALEKKSGIPARVFQMVKTTHKTRDVMIQAAEYLFDVNDSSMYNDDRVDYFQDICIEYLDGNDIKYKEENVRVVAEEAARIYSDCVGIHNADSIKQYVATVSRICSRIESACALVSFTCGILIIVMYKRREKGYLYASSGLIAGGFGTALGALAGIVTRAGANYSVDPAVYQHAFYSMTRTSILYIMLFGIFVMAIGIACFMASIYKLKLEKDRKDTRFSKVVDRL